MKSIECINFRSLTHLLLATCCLFACLSIHPALALPKLPDGYVLVYDEPFNGKSILDTTFGYQWTGYEGTKSTVEGVSLKDGYLTLTSYSTEKNGKVQNWGGTVATKNYNGGNRQWTYGYYESRIKFNNAPGNCMAFWLVSDRMFGSTVYPASDGNEVDIIEHRMTDGDMKIIPDTHHIAIHWGGYSKGHHQASVDVAIPGLDTGFHKFGLLWTDKDFKIYCDDKLIKTFTPTEEKPFMSNGPAWIILDSDPCGGWCGPIPEAGYGSLATSTTKMVVDYVRVYNIPTPMVTVSAPSASITSTTPVTFTVSYYKADSVNLKDGDITLKKTGTANGTVSVSGTGTDTRTVTVSNITGAGKLSIYIAPGTASNSFGKSSASGESETVTVEAALSAK